MAQQKGKAIFLDTTDGTVYNKTWGGLNFSVTKLPDKSVKVVAHDQESQVCEPRENDYGIYWIAKLYGGVGIVSFKPSKQGDGDYCLLKLNDEVKLPSTKKQGGGGYKKPYGKAASGAKASTPW